MRHSQAVSTASIPGSDATRKCDAHQNGNGYFYRVPRATALSRQCRWTVIVSSGQGESNSTLIVPLQLSRAHRMPQSHWRSKTIARGTRKRTINVVMCRLIAPWTVPPPPVTNSISSSRLRSDRIEPPHAAVNLAAANQR